MKYELINCKPVPKRLYGELREIGFGNDLVVSSCLRTQHAVSWARSKGCTLSSQQELYNCFRAGDPNCNPANPPGQSTHELRNDGVAFPGPARMWLAYYKVGIDAGDRSRAAVACERARARGWVATITYPASPREGHHINFRKEPVFNPFKPLKLGSKGKRVAALTARLEYLGYGVEKTGGFGEDVERAVKRYQRDHDLGADGVVGIHTDKQLKVTVRHKKECRKAAMKLPKPKQEGALKKCNRRFGPEPMKEG